MITNQLLPLINQQSEKQKESYRSSRIVMSDDFKAAGDDNIIDNNMSLFTK